MSDLTEADNQYLQAHGLLFQTFIIIKEPFFSACRFRCGIVTDFHRGRTGQNAACQFKSNYLGAGGVTYIFFIVVDGFNGCLL